MQAARVFPTGIVQALLFVPLLCTAGAVTAQIPSAFQGSSCGCPDVSARDTVWVTDNAGAGIGTMTWTCDHHYVLSEQVFVNGGDTLTIEPGVVVFGAPGVGRNEVNITVPFGIGLWRSVTYASYPGALIVARGGYLHADATASCPIQFTFLGDPLDGSVGLDVQGQWGGVVLCGAAQLNTLALDQSFATNPSTTTGLGTGEDRAEGIVDVSQQDRHVYGGNTDPEGSSGVLRYVSLRHGSTNLGWTQFGNGSETDLLQLAGCGSGTVVEYIECMSSADDGVHILGGMVELRHVMSGFHAEDAFESDQSWSGIGQFLFGIQDTALAVATNPPGESFLYDAEGDDLQDNNMDLSSEPFSTPMMHNLTLVSNGAEDASTFHSLPGGEWQNIVTHGTTVCGFEIQDFLSCDGWEAMRADQYGILTIRNCRTWGDVATAGDLLPAYYDGYLTFGQTAVNGWFEDSLCTVEEVLLQGEFSLESGLIASGMDPRPAVGNTVSAYYQASDNRLDVVSYHGAFEPNVDPWFVGWSMLDHMGLYADATNVVEEPGCMDEEACNYSVIATVDDGTCEFESCAGCTYALACNFNPLAWIENGTCDFNTCSGCTYIWACNYDPEATLDNGSCELESCAGCTFPEAINYDPAALWDDGSCDLPSASSCSSDINGDGYVTSSDLLDFLGAYGDVCPN
ncbi:MAG: hypothetical protein O2791_05995 [Bacteroidetes bacterium]|nr:hypothetical protein [Bacteroidota bacterium]